MKRRSRTSWSGPCLVLLLALAWTPVRLEGQLRARTSVDTTLVTVGDQIRLSVSVEHPVDATVLWPDSLALGPFEVLDARASQAESTGDRATSTAVLTLTAFELGDLEIPSFDLTVLFADGGTETLATDRYGVEVVSVGADETGDIRGIRGPLSISIGVIYVGAWVLLALLLAGVAFWSYRRFTKRDTGGVRVEGPPPRPAHEIALEALGRLEASPLLGSGEVKEYHIEVSDILRRYVEARYGVMALEMTTWEILGGLERHRVAADVREGLGRFLDQCDRVKFAKVRPHDTASREVLSLGRELVEMSTFVVESVVESVVEESADERPSGVAG